jgi:hypothetical protein
MGESLFDEHLEEILSSIALEIEALPMLSFLLDEEADSDDFTYKEKFEQIKAFLFSHPVNVSLCWMVASHYAIQFYCCMYMID